MTRTVFGPSQKFEEEMNLNFSFNSPMNSSMTHLLETLDVVVQEASSSKNEYSFSRGIVSHKLLYIFTILNYVILCDLVAIFGIVANVINIIVFLRMGFADTINISFFGMAVSDLILQMMTFLICIIFNPWFEAAFQRSEVLYFIGGWIQVTTTRITGWITAFVTLERCLCIAMPLKVKDIISPPRAMAVNITIFLVSIICMVPISSTGTVGWTFDHIQNVSLLTFIHKESGQELYSALSFLNNVVLALITFSLVVIGTVHLGVGITRTRRWRSQFSTNTDDSNTKVRDQKVIKMVVTIAAIYIICYTPTMGIFIWNVEDVEFSITGRLRNLFLLLSSFAFLFESINSSFNIFIYLHMSTKYKTTFQSLWSSNSKCA